jgi:RNA polymerase sigma-70 factor (ECF subfamily)
MLAPMRPVSHADEEDLVARAQAGDERAFEELVRRHADRLFAIIVRFIGDRQEAEEATQEAFLRAWRSIDRFKRDSRFFTWLYRIGINEAKRRVGRRPSPAGPTSLDEHPADEVPDWSQAPEVGAAERELQRVLEEAIRELGPDHRAPLILRDIEGLSTSEAAETLDIGEAAFKSRLHRARLSVRRAVDDYLGEDR